MTTIPHDDAGRYQESEYREDDRERYGEGSRMRSSDERYRINDPRRKSAFIAGVLSFIPGLGQVYVGYYRQGFINVAVAGSVFSLSIAMDDSTLLPLGLMFLIFFLFYNIIDASRRATLYNLTLDGIENIALPDELSNNPLPIQGSFLLGGAMLVFGAVALSHTLFGLPLEWLEQFWPVVPMFLGAWLVYQAFVDGQKDTTAEEQE